MTKTNCKTNTSHKVFFGVALLIFSVAISFAQADEMSGNSGREEKIQQRIADQQQRMQDREEKMTERKEQMEERKTERQAASCERIVSASRTHFQKFSENKKNFGEKMGEKLGAFEDRRDNRDAQASEIREKQDTRRDEMYAKLRASAKTDEQKAAVEAFQKTVDEAISDRREAVDTAIEAFRKEVNTLAQSKRSGMEVSVESFEVSMKEAFEKAESSCSNGDDPKTVRETLMASLKKNRESLEESRRSFEKIGGSVSSLAKIRQEAVQKALDDFKATMEKARADLKEAFSQE